jgi:hypothetical protein
VLERSEEWFGEVSKVFELIGGCGGDCMHDPLFGFLVSFNLFLTMAMRG